MEKDIFDYLINLSKEEYRKESCIDDIYDIEFPEEILKIEGMNTKFYNFVIADSVKNYKNEVLYTKIQYMTGIRYYEELKKLNVSQEELETYDFLCREYLNHVLICLYSIYDKTYHILNDIYGLNIDYNVEKTKYKESIRDSLKMIDKPRGKRITSIFYKITDAKYVTLRDNNVHNKSDAFVKFEKDYMIPMDNIKVIKEIPLDELNLKIEEICKLINEQKELINELIKEIGNS